VTGREHTPAAELEARLSYLAHELLNPLSVAKGYASLLKDGATDADETVRSFAARVCENLEVAVLLMQRLRDGGADVDLQLDRGPLDLVDLVRATSTALGDTVAADRPVELDVPDDPVTVEGDPVRLRQVLFNLLLHAARSSPAGTPLRVTLDRRPIQLAVHAPAAIVDAEELERSFAVRDDGLPPATGPALGLHVSRRLAEAHGGSLRVEAVGSGAQVVVGLPSP
jgi:two-component system, OmpR family, sensor kinase